MAPIPRREHARRLSRRLGDGRDRRGQPPRRRSFQSQGRRTLMVDVPAGMTLRPVPGRPQGRRDRHRSRRLHRGSPGDSDMLTAARAGSAESARRGDRRRRPFPAGSPALEHAGRTTTKLPPSARWPGCGRSGLGRVRRTDTTLVGFEEPSADRRATASSMMRSSAGGPAHCRHNGWPAGAGGASASSRTAGDDIQGTPLADRMEGLGGTTVSTSRPLRNSNRLYRRAGTTTFSASKARPPSARPDPRLGAPVLVVRRVRGRSRLFRLRTGNRRLAGADDTLTRAAHADARPSPRRARFRSTK